MQTIDVLFRHGILAILEAAHIKPYVVCCEQGQREETFDPKNGLTLRADLHKLFDAKPLLGLTGSCSAY